MAKNSTRKNRGAALAEGAIGLMIVVSGTLLAAVLLLNVLGATFNKEKIGYIADEAAIYAAALPDDASRPTLVTDKVNQLLMGMGYDNATSSVTISNVTIASKKAIKVKVTCTLPTMLSAAFASVLPSQILVTDSAVAVTPSYFWAYGVGTLPSGQKYVSPIISATGALPADNLPAHALTIAILTKIR